MEIAIMHSGQALPNMFMHKSKDQNHSDDEEFSTAPYLLSVKKSHSTPHRSFNDKQSQLSDHRQLPQKENELHEIKERIYLLQKQIHSAEQNYFFLKHQTEEKTETQNDDHMGRNKEESCMTENTAENAQMRKISTAASEELKVDYPQNHGKRNSNQHCNLYDDKKSSNENLVFSSSSGQKNNSPYTNNNPNIQRQEDSKQLQTLYQESSEKNKLFEEKIRKHIKEFALDKYQHFILIMSLDIGPNGHKRIIIETIQKEKEYYSHEQFGHKILNKCIEVSKKECPDLYKEFVKYIIDSNSKTYQSLQNDKFGNYVIQKCLETFEDDHLTDLLFLLNTTLLIKPEQKLATLPSEKQHKDSDLCSDQYGCLIIQKLIEIYKVKEEGKIKRQVGLMIEKVINDSYRLAQRQFSNYVVQQILEKGATEHKHLLYTNVISKYFINLSMDKYGSNVAEKAVKFADQEQQKMIWSIISSQNFSPFFNMVNDQYANYVVQRIFDEQGIKEKKQIYSQLNDWNKKNKLKENGKHPFKYIDDQMKLNEQNAHMLNFQQKGNQIKQGNAPNPNQQQQSNFNRNQNSFNNNNNNYKQSSYEQNYYNNQPKNTQRHALNQDNYENNQNQRYQYQNNNVNYKNNNDHQKEGNDYQGQRVFNQVGNQNRNNPNNQKKNRNNKDVTAHSQTQGINKQNQNTIDIPIPTYEQHSSPKYNSQISNNNNNNRYQNQQNQQHSAYNQQQQQHQQQKNYYEQNQQQQLNRDSSNKRNNQSELNNLPYNQKQRRNGNHYNKRGYFNNNNNPGYYYPNSYYQMQNYYQNPYYPNQQHYAPFPYQGQEAYYQRYFNPHLHLLAQTNEPIIDFLNGAHILLQQQKKNEEIKQEHQSENKTEPNSLQPTRTNEEKQEDQKEKENKDKNE